MPPGPTSGTLAVCPSGSVRDATVRDLLLAWLRRPWLVPAGSSREARWPTENGTTLRAPRSGPDARLAYAVDLLRPGNDPSWAITLTPGRAHVIDDPISILDDPGDAKVKTYDLTVGPGTGRCRRSRRIVDEVCALYVDTPHLVVLGCALPVRFHVARSPVTLHTDATVRGFAPCHPQRMFGGLMHPALLPGPMEGVVSPCSPLI